VIFLVDSPIPLRRNPPAIRVTHLGTLEESRAAIEHERVANISQIAGQQRLLRSLAASRQFRRRAVQIPAPGAVEVPELAGDVKTLATSVVISAVPFLAPVGHAATILQRWMSGDYQRVQLLKTKAGNYIYQNNRAKGKQ
jgi:hypothetical protein